MKKIALDGGFSFTDEQLVRLQACGQLDRLEESKATEEWLDRVRGYDVICTWGDHVLENLEHLENVLVTYPYTELGSFDSDVLAKKNVFVANARGGNRKSIAEWTMFSILSLYRKFPQFLRTTTQYSFTSTESLEGKRVLVIGAGTIGTEVGERCAAFGMEVEYAHRGDDILTMAKRADLVINALNCNPTSQNLLNTEFFSSMNPGSYYITFARPFTYDIDGLIAAIDSGTVAGAAIDCDPEPLFDISNAFYQKCLSNEKILVTPHIAGVTKQAAANGLELMVQNVESYLAGTPKNIVKK